MFEMSNINFIENKKIILKNINITINDGEIIGIIGRSGSGKTVLLKIIAGLNKKYTGKIIADGIAVEKNRKAKIENVSYLFDINKKDIIDDSVFNYLLNSRKHFKKILNPYSELDIQITEKYTDLFNLSEYKDQRMLSTSEGIFKKSMLAFTFVKESKILILDNPDSLLDLHSILLLHKTMQRYVIDGDKSIIIASNNINFICRSADRIILLDQGNIFTEGTPDIINAELVKKHFGVDIMISKNIYNGRPDIHLFPEN